MDDLLVWLVGTTARYWALATLTGTAVVVAACATTRIRPWMFLTALGLCLLACRAPIALNNGELGIDEGQVVAGAMKFKSHPIAWKHVDLNTAGPLNAYVLTLPGWLGLPINFLTAHLLGLALIWIALAGGYQLLRETCEDRVARCAILPAAAFFSLTTYFDFVHYTSEHLPLALLGIGAAWVWCGVNRGLILPTFFGMAALGAMPWAKLQGTPIALWVSLFGGVEIVRRWRYHSRLRARLLGAWLAGGLFASAAFALLLVIWNLGGQMRTSYLVQATAYMETGGSILKTLHEFGATLNEATGFPAFLSSLSAISLVLFGAAIFSGRVKHPALLVFLGGLLVFSVYAVAAPGRVFFHYLLFVIMPTTLLVGTLLSTTLDIPSPGGEPRTQKFIGVVLAAFLVASLAPQIVARYSRDHALIPYVSGRIHRQQGAAAQLLAASAQPGDMLTIWGWMPRLYVESGLPQATRDGQTERQIVAGPLREFYRNRYLHDLKRYRPRFFVEAVGPGQFAFPDPATAGFARWPELREFVAENYTQFAEADSCRLYRANPP
jgi:hypothetical protein